MDDNQLTYSQALAQLEKIVAELQSDQCDIDNMVVLTRRGAELLSLCRERLTTTEQQLRDVLAQLQQP